MTPPTEISKPHVDGYCWYEHHLPVVPYIVERYNGHALMVTMLTVIYAGAQFFVAPAHRGDKMNNIRTKKTHKVEDQATLVSQSHNPPTS